MADKDIAEKGLNDPKRPSHGRAGRYGRAALSAAGGAIPLVGGLLSAAAGAWSEQEQERVNQFFENWLEMLRDEIKEKEKTILEMMARLDVHDERVMKRVESPEYQSILKKTFREWAAAESETKRQYVRNVLSNAAASDLASDDVVRLFLDWLKSYSEFHFKVIAAIYNTDSAGGITRLLIWEKLGRATVREDSADADLFKLLIRDLSTGGIIRQHRPVDSRGNFIPKDRKKPQKSGRQQYVSAFDNHELYVLTQLGEQFVHYAMTDVPVKIEYKSDSVN